MPGLGFISSPFPDPARGLWSWFRYAPKTLSPFAGTISESVFGRWTVETLRGLSHPLWASLRHFLHRNVGSVRLNIDYWKNGRAACSRIIRFTLIQMKFYCQPKPEKSWAVYKYLFWLKPEGIYIAYDHVCAFIAITNSYICIPYIR